MISQYPKKLQRVLPFRLVLFPALSAANQFITNENMVTIKLTAVFSEAVSSCLEKLALVTRKRYR